MAKKTILTIDDSSSIRHAIREILEEHNYNIIEARHGQAALDYLNGKKVNMILLDLNMPEMDGHTFLQKLRTEAQYSQYANTPVVILTTVTEKESKDRAKELGAYGWISKPFDPRTLVAVVEEHSTEE